MLTFDCCSSCTYEDTGHEEVPSSYIRAAEFCVIASIIIKQNAGCCVKLKSKNASARAHAIGARTDNTACAAAAARTRMKTIGPSWAICWAVLT